VQNPQSKVTAEQLARDAYLYIRQSSLKQVIDNQESTKRQYNLRDRALALGWTRKQIIIIDCDQGQSGAEAVDREGFQKLVADVGMGRAGIVMGLEVSRLARNSADWHRLLEICGLTQTLILDEDGLYDPSHFNDRLLLGLKGTMSEAELHILRARLRGGIINKAKRGELKLSLPVGFVYDDQNHVVLDPNKRVQQAIKLLFKTFEQTGSAFLTVKMFRQKGLKFPKRPRTGPSKSITIWAELTHDQVLRTLHNPRYAGTFFYGRSQAYRTANGTIGLRSKPVDQWTVCLPDSHAAYIGQEKFEKNQKMLLANAQAHGHDRRQSPPREGPALLQGIVVCGLCGRRMTLRYHERKGKLFPDYVCQSDGIASAKKICQSIPGGSIDQKIGDLLIQTMIPSSLEVALAVQKELESNVNQVKGLREKGVQQARYEAELAQQRFMNVDPRNRLVADSLEAQWNSKLLLLSAAEEEYEKNCQKDNLLLDEKKQKAILALATDFPKLWQDPKTPDREKKRMARLLIEDITLIKKDNVVIQVRFKGGASKSYTIPLPINGFEAKRTPEKVITEVSKLLDKYHPREIADILNKRSWRTGDNRLFTTAAIHRIQTAYKLKDRRQRLIDQGMLTRPQIKKLLGVGSIVLKKWKDQGVLKVYNYGDNYMSIMYENPGDQLAKLKVLYKWEMLRRLPQYKDKTLQEVQYEM
jgi:DNA invertase Pin-like site-specific DNA recombinase